MAKFEPLILNGTIAEDFHLNSDDIRKAKIALNEIGLYEMPRHGVTDERDASLIEAIRNYQRHRGLRVDGKIRPGGETEQDINRTLGEFRTSARSPIFRCKERGAPHGGAKGDLCPSCDQKKNS
ncbi:MAG: peptidoglycan-binding domain-containing protein [Rickettsiales bacterium]